jgi:hypothetical protein
MNVAFAFVGAAIASCLTISAAFSQNEPPHFDVVAEGMNYPIVHGTTNLPDGTILLVDLKKPWLPDGQERIARGLPACEGDCISAEGPDRLIGATVVVKRGSFSAGPFSFKGNPI